jgi:SAM-dependent methyltransferase
MADSPAGTPLDRDAMTRSSLRLPPRDSVVRTDPDDPVDYYYRLLTGPLYRGRLRLMADLLDDGRHASLLDVGYGSGVFLPELARRADRLVGVDLHDQHERIAELLAREGVQAELTQASLYELPFAAEEFDALVCVSVLEHLTDLDGALDELRRVLRLGGVAVLGFPVRNPITDFFFRRVGYDPREIHPSSHDDVLRAARRHPGLAVEREDRFPRLLPLPLSAYAACRCRAQ